MKIKVLSKPFELEIKRCYLPVVVEAFCPECKTKCIQDLGDNYLSYPTLNGEEELYFCCENEGCENEFSKYINIGLNIQEVKKDE